ncbi:Alpha-D-glucose-1-phosphate phosphatase YihX [Botrimarina colliarenosi]|uniref:Alpha-D-glucose-1-phosphate phosphatase YihX n=1 Tax=Botrimarina colliarenosi TaxID=2528001 RepID=A0A5C6AD71_9BACT|nr:HAD family phosphatase [Botrimarina colliarenosi]TWT98002.1 Alpha-D-glucose-1-phosphate phosphatase YihX [Botrimarina colliarenosi]
MPKTPEFLYFDLGRVLLKFDHPRMLRQMAEVAGVEIHVLREAIMPTGSPTEGDAQWRLEAGELTEDAYYDELCERIGRRPQRDKLEMASSDIFGPIGSSLDLLERLKEAGYRLGLLSNTCATHWRWFLDGRFPTLNSVFEVQIGSFQVGSMKPAAPIYEAAIAKAGVPADQIFFADDRQENVDGAIACGIDAVLFTDTAKLEYDLRARGIDC